MIAKFRRQPFNMTCIVKYDCIFGSTYDCIFGSTFARGKFDSRVAIDFDMIGFSKVKLILLLQL